MRFSSLGKGRQGQRFAGWLAGDLFPRCSVTWRHGSLVCCPWRRLAQPQNCASTTSLRLLSLALWGRQCWAKLHTRLLLKAKRFPPDLGLAAKPGSLTLFAQLEFPVAVGPTRPWGGRESLQREAQLQNYNQILMPHYPACPAYAESLWGDLSSQGKGGR